MPSDDQGLLLDGPVAKLNALAPRCVGPTFDRDVFEQTGVSVITGVFPKADVDTWRADWAAFYAAQLASRRVDRFNPVAVHEAPPDELRAIYRHPALLDIAAQLFGPEVSLFNFRFVIKDKHSRDPVFKHQDIPYHLGKLARASFFVPLSHAGARNGGMRFVLGTNNFGYLGDAGEIAEGLLPNGWPTLTPEVSPGDLIVMDSATWHESVAHVEGEDRILADIILVPSSDPTAVEPLRGNAVPEYKIPFPLWRKLLKRSRVTRLVELEAELKKLRAAE